MEYSPKQNPQGNFQQNPNWQQNPGALPPQNGYPNGNLTQVPAQINIEQLRRKFEPRAYDYLKKNSKGIKLLLLIFIYEAKGNTDSFIKSIYNSGINILDAVKEYYTNPNGVINIKGVDIKYSILSGVMNEYLRFMANFDIKKFKANYSRLVEIGYSDSDVVQVIYYLFKNYNGDIDAMIDDIVSKGIKPSELGGSPVVRREQEIGRPQMIRQTPLKEDHEISELTKFLKEHPSFEFNSVLIPFQENINASPDDCKKFVDDCGITEFLYEKPTVQNKDMKRRKNVIHFVIKNVDIFQGIRDDVYNILSRYIQLINTYKNLNLQHDPLEILVMLIVQNNLQDQVREILLKKNELFLENKRIEEENRKLEEREKQLEEDIKEKKKSDEDLKKIREKLNIEKQLLEEDKIRHEEEKNKLKEEKMKLESEKKDINIQKTSLQKDTNDLNTKRVQMNADDETRRKQLQEQDEQQRKRLDEELKKLRADFEKEREEVKKREKAVEAREESTRQREIVLNNKEEQLSKHEAELVGRETSVGIRESSAYNKESDLNQKEQEIINKQNEITIKEEKVLQEKKELEIKFENDKNSIEVIKEFSVFEGRAVGMNFIVPLLLHNLNTVDFRDINNILQIQDIRYLEIVVEYRNTELTLTLNEIISSPNMNAEEFFTSYVDFINKTYGVQCSPMWCFLALLQLYNGKIYVIQIIRLLLDSKLNEKIIENDIIYTLLDRQNKKQIISTDDKRDKFLTSKINENKDFIQNIKYFNVDTSPINYNNWKQIIMYLKSMFSWNVQEDGTTIISVGTNYMDVKQLIVNYEALASYFATLECKDDIEPLLVFLYIFAKRIDQGMNIDSLIQEFKSKINGGVEPKYGLEERFKFRDWYIETATDLGSTGKGKSVLDFGICDTIYKTLGWEIRKGYVITRKGQTEFTRKKLAEKTASQLITQPNVQPGQPTGQPTGQVSIPETGLEGVGLERLLELAKAKKIECFRIKDLFTEEEQRLLKEKSVGFLPLGSSEETIFQTMLNVIMRYAGLDIIPSLINSINTSILEEGTKMFIKDMEEYLNSDDSDEEYEEYEDNGSKKEKEKKKEKEQEKKPVKKENKEEKEEKRREKEREREKEEKEEEREIRKRNNTDRDDIEITKKDKKKKMEKKIAKPIEPNDTPKK